MIYYPFDCAQDKLMIYECFFVDEDAIVNLK